MECPVSDQSMLSSLRNQIGDDLALTIQGRRLMLVPGGSLAGVEQERLREAFAALRAPATICLRSEAPPSCGDDHVCAVNLTRQLDSPVRPFEVERAMDRMRQEFPSASKKVELTHFNGGPCEGSRICNCVVLGGTGQGWTAALKFFVFVLY